MATEHKLIPDAELHEPKGASSAISGQVYVADGAGSGAWAAQAISPSVTVTVESVSDFPTPVADVITLAANCVYIISGQIDVGNDRFVFSEGSILQGIHRTVSGITSTTTGALFSGTGVNMRFETLTLIATTATELYSFDGGGTKVFSARDIVSTTHTGATGNLTDALNAIIDFSVYVGGTDGISLSGSSNGGFLMQTSAFLGFTGTAIDLGTAVLTGSRLENSSIVGTGASDVGINGAAGSANLVSGATFFVTTNTFVGTTTPLQGITSQDVQYKFFDNNGVEDTHQEAQGYVNGNATTTTIAASNTPVLVDVGTGFIDAHSEQFTVSNAGRITYNGIDTEDFMVHLAVQGTGASGTNTYTVYIAKNGTVEAATGLGREFASTATGTLTTFGILALSTGDYVEPYIENNSGTTNYEAVDVNMVVKS